MGASHLCQERWLSWPVRLGSGNPEPGTPGLRHFPLSRSPAALRSCPAALAPVAALALSLRLDPDIPARLSIAMANFPKALAHGSIIPITDGVHCVRGSFNMGPAVTIGRTMTVVDGGDGLVVFNAVRLSEEGEAELEKLGKPSDAHCVDEPYYADRYQPTVWAMPTAKMGDLSVGNPIGAEGPIQGAKVIGFGDLKGWAESAYWLPVGGGTLITCDVVQNCTDQERFSFIGRIMCNMMGFKGGVVTPPMWRKVQKLKGAELGDSLSTLAELKFENFVSGHGGPVIGGADKIVKGAIASAVAA